MALKIRINNLNRKRRIGQKDIKKAAFFVLSYFKKKNALIDITFINNRRIKSLNKKYMRKPKTTDVLSFLLDEAVLAKKKTIVGDVYISSDMAQANARRFGTTFRREILLYTIHGVLHLLGFPDKTKKQKEKIRKLEQKFIKLIT